MNKMILLLALILGSTLSVTAFAADEIDVSGLYRSGQGDVRVSKHGVGYQVRWDFPTGERWIGVGLLEGNVFSAAWGADRSVGISIFRVDRGEKGPKLVGRWAQYRDTATGPETWIFVSK